MSKLERCNGCLNFACPHPDGGDPEEACLARIAMVKPTCPDCREVMVKSWIECEDGSGFYCGWLCGCKRPE